MRISTLSIGDELICGEVIDTNAAHIAKSLLERGLRVRRHMTVGDVETDIAAALNELAPQNDALIVTGGLGPTVDDVTAMAAARATGLPLVVNEEAREHLHRFLAERGTLAGGPPSDKQAMIPAEAAIIPNRVGTASGFRVSHEGCLVFFLPGVPVEMKPMLGETVLPCLLERLTLKRSVLSAYLNLFGLSEPQTDRLLDGVADERRGVRMSICVTFPWIRVTLRAEADTEAVARASLHEALDLARERLGGYVFSEGTECMDEVVAGLFRQRGMTLALAESCTGGMIARRITDVPGSSAYFLEGLVTYSNSAKTRLLGVPAELIETKGAVSAEVAAAMAAGVRAAAGSDLGLAVTGIAGPDGGSAEKPVGTVFISLAAPDGCRTERFRFGGSRSEVRIITAWTAMDWLRRYLGSVGSDRSDRSDRTATEKTLL
ncbi:MAG: competence/damage-inducible protein A [Deltaproteobacteria bacterium]|nr:competence/damage-inducible protein A [Deltaproteobacteria bacterium]